MNKLFAEAVITEKNCMKVKKSVCRKTETKKNVCSRSRKQKKNVCLFACINSVRSVVCSLLMSSSAFCITMGGSGGRFFCPGCRRRMDTPTRSSSSKYSTTATVLTLSPPNGSSLLSSFDETKEYQYHI